LDIIISYRSVEQWFSNGGTRTPWRARRCSKRYTNF